MNPLLTGAAHGAATIELVAIHEGKHFLAWIPSWRAETFFVLRNTRFQAVVVEALFRTACGRPATQVRHLRDAKDNIWATRIYASSRAPDATIHALGFILDLEDQATYPRLLNAEEPYSLHEVSTTASHCRVSGDVAHYLGMSGL
jgi:hypothetical protein